MVFICRDKVSGHGPADRAEAEGVGWPQPDRSSQNVSEYLAGCAPRRAPRRFDKRPEFGGKSCGCSFGEELVTNFDNGDAGGEWKRVDRLG